MKLHAHALPIITALLAAHPRRLPASSPPKSRRSRPVPQHPRPCLPNWRVGGSVCLSWRRRRRGGWAGQSSCRGKGADVTLQPSAHIVWPVRPERPGDAASHGGVLEFAIARPSLSCGARRGSVGGCRAGWQGRRIHYPCPWRACTGIRKMVDFPLAPGVYVLEIAGNEKPQIPVLLVRLP